MLELACFAPGKAPMLPNLRRLSLCRADSDGALACSPTLSKRPVMDVRASPNQPRVWYGLSNHHVALFRFCWTLKACFSLARLEHHIVGVTWLRWQRHAVSKFTPAWAFFADSSMQASRSSFLSLSLLPPLARQVRPRLRMFYYALV